MTGTGRTLTLALFLSLGLTATAVAQAWESRDQYIRTYYETRPRDGLYEGWTSGRWTNEDYRNWYRTHHREEDRVRDREAAALFGLSTGSLTIAGVDGDDTEITGSLAGKVPPAGGFQPGTPEYNRYCSGKYRSFDPATGTFMSFSGERRPCR